MDLTADCEIKFTEAVFTGKYPKAKFSHDRTIHGIITKESYGAKTGQHTFTIQVIACDDDSISEGSKIRRKGRNVYRNCTVINYPDNHKSLADEKHERSAISKRNVALLRAQKRGDFLQLEKLSKSF